MRPKVYAIAIETTAHCQQKCSYCYNAWREDNGAGFDAGAQKQLLARVDKLLTALDVDHVTVTGGEPFARRDVFDLFTVTTRVADRGEYLLRPDLGRLLSDEGKKLIAERCVKGPDVQLCVVDGLSAAAIDNNLRDIYPVIEQGLKSAGLSVGTPFFIENGRVGIMNDVNSIIKAKVVVLLIGERPGLGIADAMSAYMGFDPQPGKSDADRDLICMITTHGGTNPLEAGAYIVEFIKRMTKYSASGVKLREVAGD